MTLKRTIHDESMIVTYQRRTKPLDLWTPHLKIPQAACHTHIRHNIIMEAKTYLKTDKKM